MSIYNNRGELDLDIAKYLNRDDEDIIKRIPNWIHMAEDYLDRMLRHPASLTRAFNLLNEGDIEFEAPIKLVELKTIRIKQTGQELYRRSIETLNDGNLGYEYPMAFALLGRTIILDKPVPKDVDIEVVYYTATDKMKTSSDTNLYLFYCGDILLYLSLAEGFSYDNNPQEASYWQEKAFTAYETLQHQIDRERVAGSTLISIVDEDYLDRYF